MPIFNSKLLVIYQRVNQKNLRSGLLATSDPQQLGQQPPASRRKITSWCPLYRLRTCDLAGTPVTFSCVGALTGWLDPSCLKNGCNVWFFLALDTTLQVISRFQKCWLVVWNIFPYIGNVIIPIDELIFFRGVRQPPTSVWISWISYLLITMNHY